MEEKEKMNHLHKIIDKLPSKQKQALVMFIYDEIPQKDIAEIMNCSVASVEVFTLPKFVIFTGLIPQNSKIPFFMELCPGCLKIHL